MLSAGPQINREATAQAVAAAAAATTASGPAGAPAEKTPSANASGVIEAKPQMRSVRVTTNLAATLNLVGVLAMYRVGLVVWQWVGLT